MRIRRKLKMSAVFMGAALSLSGCVTGDYRPPYVQGDSSQYERVINKSFDETWTALIDYSSKSFFSIDHFEKASGLMTISFGSNDPTRFIDCGTFRLNFGASSYNGPYAAYLTDRFGAKLDGKMNLVVRVIDDRHTLVRANARYIFTDTGRNIWSFDSGGSATISVMNPTIGTVQTRTCFPTYVAEHGVLEDMAK